MLLRLFDLLLTDPIAFLALLPVIAATVGVGLVVAISVHEFSHALVAYQLGDDTARLRGRLSLNPLVHLDPIGTLMLLVIGFGWGKPVPVNPYYLRPGPRGGMAMVGLAGPLSNLVTAGLIALPMRLGVYPWHSPLLYAPFAQRTWSWLVADVLGYVIFFNIILALFNLIPIPPLDGFNVIQGLVPRDVGHGTFSRLAQYGPMILLLVVAYDIFTGRGILWGLLRPAVNATAAVVVGRPFF
ncbi:MAG: site-2 protease family protein [Chloroflexi bacterium]|nr:site-2 protease family protein [Chloroflexota bacterium]